MQFLLKNGQKDDTIFIVNIWIRGQETIGGLYAYTGNAAGRKAKRTI